MLSRLVKSGIALMGAVAVSLCAIQQLARADVGKGPTPRPKPSVNVKTGEGRVDGSFDFLWRKTRPEGQRQEHWNGSGTSSREIDATERERYRQECFELIGDTSCLFLVDDLANSGMLTGPLARAMAVRLVTELRLPTPTPNFGPNPNNNEWQMLAVGFPIWLWTEGPTTVSTSASASGFTFQMTARWQSTTFHMGDGNTVTCTSAEKYSASVKPATPSPNCGYAYSKPSLPKGKYRVRAVADWEVTWSVAGFSGVLPASNEASASIPIGELVALNR